LNIKLIHQRKGRLLKQRITQDSPIVIEKTHHKNESSLNASETSFSNNKDVLPAFGCSEQRKTRERDSKMRFSYQMPQVAKAINPDLRLSVKDLTSTKYNALNELDKKQMSLNYNSCLNS
jgi:hypothetical protein